MTVVILSQCEKENPQFTIPDNNFLNALIELGVDTNGDGFISPAETEAITFLGVSSDSISDMTGIEKFVNLDTLWCYNNQISSLDVSKNTALGPSSAYGFPDLNLSQMPTLYHVCVWEMPFPPAGVYVDTTGSPNVYFTADCN